MSIALIVAVDKNGGIGKDNQLLWRLPADMKFFREMTTGHIVVTGRKNYESIPEKFRPLPNRENAVLTRNADYEAPCPVFGSLDDCLAHYANETERMVFIIGGGEIYRQAIATGKIDTFYVTHVDVALEADTFFPVECLEGLKKEKLVRHEADEKNVYGFEIVRYWR